MWLFSYSDCWEQWYLWLSFGCLFWPWSMSDSWECLWKTWSYVFIIHAVATFLFVINYRWLITKFVHRKTVRKQIVIAWIHSLLKECFWSNKEISYKAQILLLKLRSPCLFLLYLYFVRTDLRDYSFIENYRDMILYNSFNKFSFFS